MTDQTGAAVVGAGIVFQSDSKTTTAYTAEKGAITVRLPSGDYVVTATAPGFRKTRILDFRVQAPSPAKLDVTLLVEFIVDYIDSVIVEIPLVTTKLPDTLLPEKALGCAKGRCSKCKKP